MKNRELPRSIERVLKVFVPGPWEASVAGDFQELWEASSRSRMAHLRLLLCALGVGLRFQWLHWQRLSTSDSYAESRYRESSSFMPLGWVEGMLRDFSYSWRRLCRAPGFLLVAVLIMGLGIGANTAMFSIVNAMLWGQRPFPKEDELVRIYTTRQDRKFAEAVSRPDLEDYLRDNPLLEETVVSSDLIFLNLVTKQRAEVVLGEFYSSDFMRVVGLEPFLGRHFAPEEGEVGRAPAVAMVSYGEWEKRYGSDPEVLGRKIRLNGQPVTIIGVGARGYGGSVNAFQASYFLPLGSAAMIDLNVARAAGRRQSRGLFVYARPAPGVAPAQIQALLDARARQLAEAYPESNKDYTSVLVIPARKVQLHPSVDVALLPVALILMTVVGLVLLVACSNLANLLLMRAASRGREMAIRRSLGASRLRLVKLLLAESTVLGVLGGVVGWLMAVWLSHGLLSFETPLPVPLALKPSLDYRVLVFTGLISVGTGILFGLAPALRVSRLDLVSALKSTQALMGPKGGRLNLRRFFVTLQVTASLLLLSVGGFCVHSLLSGQDRDFGFRTQGLAMAVVDPELGGYEEEGAPARFFERLRTRLLEEGDIQQVGFSHRIPYGFFGTDRIPYRSRRPSVDGRDPVVEMAVVDSEYFGLMGISLLGGRGFSPGLVSSAPSTAIVSRSFAEREWGTPQVVGESLQLEGRERKTLEIIGVVEDLSYGSDLTEMLYLPYPEQPRSPLIVLARGTGEEKALPALLRRLVADVDHSVPVLEAKTMDSHLGIAFFIPRLLGVLLLAFGTLAILLAGIGLYGLIAYSVAHRSREMAVRMTLGAETRQIIVLVVREGLGLVLVGACLGILISTLASIPLSRLLYGVPPLDPLVLGGMLVVLFATAILASYLPARRISRLNPISTLRHE